MYTLALGGELTEITLNDSKPYRDPFNPSALLDIHRLYHHNRQHPRPYFPLRLRWADPSQHHRFGYFKGMTSHLFATSSQAHTLQGTRPILAHR